MISTVSENMEMRVFCIVQSVLSRTCVHSESFGHVEWTKAESFKASRQPQCSAQIRDWSTSHLRHNY